MFFRKDKNKAKAEASQRAAIEKLQSAGPDSSVNLFLTGDTARDSMSVYGLLEEVRQITEVVARVTGPDDLEDLLIQIVDASIKHTGAERGLLVLPGAGDEFDVRVARKSGNQPIVDNVRYSTTAISRVLDCDGPIKDSYDPDSDQIDLSHSVGALKLRALMATPLSTGSPDKESAGKRGVLYVDSKVATRVFTDEDLAFFNTLAWQIAAALESARLHLDSLEKARLVENLEIARTIQNGLMPKIPDDRLGFDFFGWFAPAERTSGDFYDFVQTKDGRSGVVVGDATGHGIGPALVTASAQASLRSYLRLISQADEAITLLNQDLSERLEPGLFVTLSLAVLAEDGSVDVVNAGHTPPLVWRKATGEIESIPNNGPALGMMGEYKYDIGQTLALESGDVLLMLSDGIVEARSPNSSDEFFSDEGVRRVLDRCASTGSSAQEITEALVHDVLEFTGGVREDDMTVVAVRRI